MLEAINISHDFQRGTPFCRQVLDGISLELRSGEPLLLTGPSGSGKTTLARILAGLERPAQGVVRFDGEAVHGHRGRDFASGMRLAMACQYPERQFFEDTVLKELSWGLRVGLGMRGPELSRRLETVSAALAFPLFELAHRSPRSLSTGQQRKVALASLMALEPQVLILDEPLAGLNAKERKRLISLLRQWLNEHRAMLVIAHELELFLDWVERVAVMMAGRLVFWDTPAALCEINDPRITEAVYLPPLIRLARQLKQHGLSAGAVSLDPKVLYQEVKEAILRMRDSQKRTHNHPGA